MTAEEARGQSEESVGIGEGQQEAKSGVDEQVVSEATLSPAASSQEDEDQEYDPLAWDEEDELFNVTEEEAYNATGPSLVERRLMGRPNKFQDVTRFVGIDPTTWMTGTVTAIHSFGVFAEVFPPGGGEEMIGFLHSARIRQGFPEMNREAVEKEFSVGQEIRVRIVHVDREQQRLALTMLENEDHLY